MEKSDFSLSGGGGNVAFPVRVSFSQLICSARKLRRGGRPEQLTEERQSSRLSSAVVLLSPALPLSHLLLLLLPPSSLCCYRSTLLHLSHSPSALCALLGVVSLCCCCAVAVLSSHPRCRSRTSLSVSPSLISLALSHAQRHSHERPESVLSAASSSHVTFSRLSSHPFSAAAAVVPSEAAGATQPLTASPLSGSPPGAGAQPTQQPVQSVPGTAIVTRSKVSAQLRAAAARGELP